MRSSLRSRTTRAVNSKWESREPGFARPAEKGSRMRPHHELRVWRDAMDLVERLYVLTAGFPADERFGLTAQMRRAGVSVASNIAAGAARGSRKDFLRFLMIARR